MDEGCDFVLIGRAGIIQRDFPLQVKSDPMYEVAKMPVTADYLRKGKLPERFINYLRGWETIVVSTSP